MVVSVRTARLTVDNSDASRAINELAGLFTTLGGAVETNTRRLSGTSRELQSYARAAGVVVDVQGRLVRVADEAARAVNSNALSATDAARAMAELGRRVGLTTDGVHAFVTAAKASDAQVKAGTRTVEEHSAAMARALEAQRKAAQAAEEMAAQAQQQAAAIEEAGRTFDNLRARVAAVPGAYAAINREAVALDTLLKAGRITGQEYDRWLGELVRDLDFATRGFDRAAVAAERLRQTQQDSQAAFNRQLGVGATPSGSAAASADVFAAAAAARQASFGAEASRAARRAQIEAETAAIEHQIRVQDAAAARERQRQAGQASIARSTRREQIEAETRAIEQQMKVEAAAAARRQSDSARDLIGNLDRTFFAAEKAAEGQKLLDAALAGQVRGVRLSAEQHAVLSQKLRETAGANDHAARSTKLNALEMTNLSYQIQDIGISLAGGQSPFLVLAQQVPQAAMAVGGFQRAMSLLLSPAGLITMAVAAGGAAMVASAVAASSYSSSIRELDRAVRLSGGAVGLTTGALVEQADAMAGAAGVSRASAREIETAFVATGRVGGAVLGDLLKLTKDWAAATGQDLEAARDQLAEFFASPARAAEDLTRKFGLFSDAQLQAIRNAEQQGRIGQAQSILLDGIKLRAAGAADRLSWFAKAWDAVGVAVSNFFDSVGKNDAVASAEEKVRGLQKAMSDLRAEQEKAEKTKVVNSSDARQQWAGGNGGDARTQWAQGNPVVPLPLQGRDPRTGMTRADAAAANVYGASVDAREASIMAFGSAKGEEFRRLDAAVKEMARNLDPAVSLTEKLTNAETLLSDAVEAGVVSRGRAAQLMELYRQKVDAAAAAVMELSTQAQLLSVPEGFERRVAAAIFRVTNGGQNPISGERATEIREGEADVARGEVQGVTAQTERQTAAQRLLASAISDTARAQAQARVAFAEQLVAYPELGAATAKTALETKNFGAFVKTLPPDLQALWTTMQSGAAAQVAGSMTQATVQMGLQTEAAGRLAAAAGKGEAAQRRANIENQVAAARLHGLEGATRAAAEAQEAFTQAQIHGEFAGQIEQEVAANERLAAAIGKGAMAAREAEVHNKAVAQTLREIPYPRAGESVEEWNRRLAENVRLLTRQKDAADSVDLKRYLEQLKDARRGLEFDRSTIGLSEDEKIVAKARQDGLEYLRSQGKEYEKLTGAAREEADEILRAAEANGRLAVEIRHTEAAYSAIGDAIDNSIVRPLESAVDAIVKGQGESIKWSNVLKGMGASLGADFLKMATINPMLNAVGIGSYRPSLWDSPLFGGGGSGQSIVANTPATQGGGLTGMATNWGMSKAGNWLSDKLFGGGGFSGWLDNIGYSIGISAPAWTATASASVQASQLAMLQAANPQIPASALAAGYQAPTAAVPAAAGLSSYLGTAGIGLGTGMLLGGWLGTKSNSKVVGGLTGAASGAATGALAGTFLFPGIGTAVGAIIGAITGGLGGLLGTQKKATQYGGGWIDTNDAGRITRSASGGENGINGNDLLDRARAVNDVLKQVNRAAGISYGALRISTEYHEDKGHSTLIGGWEGRKASSAEDPGMIALDILRAFAKDNSLAAQYNFQAPEVVLKALRNMGDVDQETGAKILAVAAAVHEGNSALDTYIKSLSGVTKAARKSIKDSLEPMKDELDLAKQGGIEADWKAMAERQFRAIWDTASSSFTAVETALAELDGTFQAYGETIKDLNLSITEAELAAAKAAQTAKMRSDYAKTQDAQLNSARGFDFLNQIDSISETHRNNLRDVGALYGNTSEAAVRAANAGELYNRSLWNFVSQLDRSQLSKVLEEYGDSVVGLSDTIAYASQVMEARDGAARADAVRRAYLGLRGKLHANDDTPGAGQSLLNAGLNPADFPEMTATLNAGYYGKVAAGTASAGDLVNAYDRITQAFNNNRFSAEQYAQLLGDLDRAFEATAQRMANAAQMVGRVDSFLRQMDTDQYSVLPPDQQFAAARDQFRDLLGKVKGGDTSLTDELFRVAQVYRELGRGEYATAKGDGEVDKEVRAGLAGLKSEAQLQLDAAQQQLTLTQGQSDTLTRINSTIWKARDDQVSWLSKLHGLQSDLNDKLEKGFGKDLRDYGSNPTLNRMLAAALPQYKGGFAPGEFEAWVASQNVNVSKVNPSFPYLNQILTLLGADGSKFGKGGWGDPFKGMGENWQKAAARALLTSFGYTPGFELGGVIPGYVDGGVVGNGTWGRDSVVARYAGGGTIALAGGEGVLTAAATAGIGGRAVVDYINRHRALPVSANDPLPPNVVFLRPPTATPAPAPSAGAVDGVALTAAVNRVAARLDAVLAELRAGNGAAAEQQARVATETVKSINDLKSEVQELPRRLAGAMG